jgi:hypothetical protein
MPVAAARARADSLRARIPGSKPQHGTRSRQPIDFDTYKAIAYAHRLRAELHRR